MVKRAVTDKQRGTTAIEAATPSTPAATRKRSATDDGPASAAVKAPSPASRKGRQNSKVDSIQPQPAQGKTSCYKGVTYFRPTAKWRAQISAHGKTTSLGDHDTEEEAATAYDRAIINKFGRDANTNFPLSVYEKDINDLIALEQSELVNVLRSKARKIGQQSSHFRGVSLLRQTSKWHAQINVNCKQVHLGYFPTEEQAARAYDRAAINKGAKKDYKGKIFTNFDISEYTNELDLLRRISEKDLVQALSAEGKRKQTGEMLSAGLAGKTEAIFGRKIRAAPGKGPAVLKALQGRAERALPKSTARNPILLEFAKTKVEDLGNTAATGPVIMPSQPPAQKRLPSQRVASKRDASKPTNDAILTASARWQQAMPASGLELSSAPVEKRSEQPARQTPQTPSRAKPKTLAPVSPARSPASRKRRLFSALTASEQAPARSIPELKDALPTLQPPTELELFRARAYARYAKFLSPPTTHQFPEKLATTSPAGMIGEPQKARDLSKEAYLSGEVVTAAAKPLQSLMKRQRTADNGGQQATTVPLLDGPSKKAAATEVPKQGVKERQKMPRAKTTWEGRLAETFQASDVAGGQTGSLQRKQQCDPVPAVPDQSTARPLTKRQEAIEARQHAEAAATLARARQHPGPIPDEVGNALLDFAEAAELAELQDRAAERAIPTAKPRPASLDFKSIAAFIGGRTHPPNTPPQSASKSRIAC